MRIARLRAEGKRGAEGQAIRVAADLAAHQTERYRPASGTPDGANVSGPRRASYHRGRPSPARRTIRRIPRRSAPTAWPGPTRAACGSPPPASLYACSEPTRRPPSWASTGEARMQKGHQHTGDAEHRRTARRSSPGGWNRCWVYVSRSGGEHGTRSVTLADHLPATQPWPRAASRRGSSTAYARAMPGQFRSVRAC